MSQRTKREKQKKTLLRIVEKFYRKDLEEVLVKFFAPKNGTKQVLKKRVIEFIESDKNDIDFDALKKEIKRVYKSNPKIKKSPKKAKSSSAKKCANKAKTKYEKIAEYQRILNRVRNIDDDPSNQSNDSHESTDSPILKIPKPYKSPDVEPQQQTINNNNNYETLSLNPSQPFQSSASSSVAANINIYEQLAQYASGHPYAQPPLNPNHSTNRPYTPPLLPPPPFSMNLMNPLVNIFGNNNNITQRPPNAFPFGGEGLQPPTPPHMNPNSVHNPQLIRPITNSFNGSTQPINLSINNYFQSSPQNNFFQQNFYQNPVSDVLNPQTFDSLIEQQKFLLSQYPKSFQDTDNRSSSDSDVPLTEFVFKTLPKFKVIKTLKETKTIGSLTDIGIEVGFEIKPTDLEPSYYDLHMNDSLKNLLDRKSMNIQLRFTYVSDVNSNEQKDSLPEYLCIECNNHRIYTYEEGTEGMSGPFDLSDYCNYNQNKVKFCVIRPNYTFLLPCIYEISIVRFDTCDTFLSKLKQNMFQFMASDSTKQLIRSRNEQLSQDEIISINTDIKLKLICPLSCRRIQTPCRTSDCKHIECFDAHSFFKTNESRYEWFCPICQKCAQFDKLRIDGFLAEILFSTEDNITEVFIRADGSYDKIEKKNESIVIELDDSTADSDDFECSVVDSDGCIVLD